MRAADVGTGERFARLERTASPAASTIKLAVFGAMTTYLRERDRPDTPLAALARTSYDYFSRRAAVSGYGRQIF